MYVVPAIIPKSKEHLLSSLALLGGVAREVQIDLVDTAYAETASWPWATGASYEELFEVLAQVAKECSVEVDLMTAEAGQIADGLIESGVQRVVFHPRKEGGWPEISSYRGRTLLGIAVYNDTPLEDFSALADGIDFVQCMGIAQVGAQGLPFDERILSDIADIHAKFPKLEISIDGHVSIFTLPLLKHAGATRFVAGSAILSAEDPQKAYRELQALAEA